MNLTKQQKIDALIEECRSLKIKADKWDKLGDEIEKCYVVKNESFDEDDPSSDEYLENEDEGTDLGTIGELAAIAYGWL